MCLEYLPRVGPAPDDRPDVGRPSDRACHPQRLRHRHTAVRRRPSCAGIVVPHRRRRTWRTQGEPWHWTSGTGRSSGRSGGPGSRADRPPTVAIVGGGLSGLATAIQLVRSGVRTFTVLEQSDGVGGTWRDNVYPGAACDVPSHLYSFSFAPKTDWSRRFAEQPEILAYAEDLVDRYDLAPHLRTGTTVTAARSTRPTATWRLDLDGASGADTLEADTVVFACGQLNRPHVPEIDGVDNFAGPSWHSARWDHSVDLGGQAGGRRRDRGRAPSSSCPRWRRRPGPPPCSSAAPAMSDRRRTTRTRPPPDGRCVASGRSARPTAGGSTGRLEMRWLSFRRDSWAGRQLQELVPQGDPDRTSSTTGCPSTPWFPTTRSGASGS